MPTVRNMSNRPWQVTFIGWLFVAVGILGFVYHAAEFRIQAPFEYGLVWVQFVRLLAIIGGVFLLRGANWARWLLLAWMGYHVILSVSHSMSELIMHVVLGAAIAYVLLQPQVSQYFQSNVQNPGSSREQE